VTDFSQYLLRYATDSTASELGVLDERGLAPLGLSSMSELLALRLSDVRSLIADRAAGPRRTRESVAALPPVDGQMEVWGAGVTYRRSMVAREEESDSAAAYRKVYEADRPELFLKGCAWRVLTDDDAAGIRRDAGSSVPEPELALVINAYGEIVGATVCDDLTARSIEGENPLYLSQAKIYTGSCVLGSLVRPWWEITDPRSLIIALEITRDGASVFTGTTSTENLNRDFESLVEWLYRANTFPHGAVLATGTGIVPPLDLSLNDGDQILITIDEVGSLSHAVAAVGTSTT
jgi:2-dehydro-3-deoxy-D-arabinonate dehydratase